MERSQVSEFMHSLATDKNLLHEGLAQVHALFLAENKSEKELQDLKDRWNKGCELCKEFKSLFAQELNGEIFSEMNFSKSQLKELEEMAEEFAKITENKGI